MSTPKIALLCIGASALLSGCFNTAPPKYENGQYVPPPAKHALKVDLSDCPCNVKPSDCKEQAIGTRSALGPLATVVGTALINQGYDQFINWLDAKQANLSASSTGVTTTEFLTTENKLKQCLILSRGPATKEDLVVTFAIEKAGENSPYWHMVPFSLDFKTSEAKEDAEGEKSIVADIQFEGMNDKGELKTYFQATFDLGQHQAREETINQKDFVGQDSGPFGLPKTAEKDKFITTKITASVIENGEGRDWIRGVTDSLRKQENREKILQPILDSLNKATGTTGTGGTSGTGAGASNKPTQ